MKRLFVHIKNERGIVTQRQLSTLGSPERAILRMVKRDSELEKCLFRTVKGRDMSLWMSHDYVATAAYLEDKDEPVPERKEPRDPFMLAGIRLSRLTSRRQNNGLHA